ncbi:MAG: nucleoside hydrolase [Cytophagales bacterium]|uniref:nucleoside hydrolase n=1 Tax=Cyclobacterium marinum TaxID=104 RepID=UPI0030D8932F|nr:nucleoside hydrolase [Cytophagales bacterium]|tara:strand:- start:112327 stop:113298 length:972 start_codon:yes stop_codon:yes gene_type:complete
MNRNIQLFLILFFAFTFTFHSKAQVPVILDADLDSDVDDVGALAMLHTLENQQKIKILGVVVTSDDKDAAGCAAAINTYYNRPDIPIGVEKGIALRSFSKYTKQLATNYPHPLKNGKQPEDATRLYRRLLVNSPDNSVIIISIGHLTNIRKLLNSKADQISPLSGKELIQKKVKIWSCMGGKFPNGKEANFYRPDPESTQIAVKNWPGKVIFSGWEIGNNIITGADYLKHALDSDHPVSLAYQLFNGYQGRQSWDQTSILVALSDKKYWNLSPKGNVIVYEDGSNAWEETPEGSHQYLIESVPPTEIAKIIDALMVGIYRPGF